MARLTVTKSGRIVSQSNAGGVVALPVVGFMATAAAAFIRHCWWTLTILMSDLPLTAGKVVLAVLGIVFPPLGALHGVWLWLN